MRAAVIDATKVNDVLSLLPIYKRICYLCAPRFADHLEAAASRMRPH
jgi:hypothetical protein